MTIANPIISATRCKCVAVLFIFSVAAFNNAAADPVIVTDYDFEQTPASGYGGWSHTYSGVISDTGRTLSTSASGPVPILNYSGGSGSLNDGQLSANLIGTHLFTTQNDDTGLPIIPAITLHLGSKVVVNEVRVFGGYIEYNATPGALKAATIEIDGVAIPVGVTPVGTSNALGIQVDGIFDLRSTPLAGIATDKIILRGFTGSFSGIPWNQFSLTEITVDGLAVITPVAIDIVPGSKKNKIEPGSHANVPVGILSNATFDAPKVVDQNSLTFGRTGDEKSLQFCQPIPRDVNLDGRADLFCFFKINLTSLAAGDLIGVLKGQTTSGDAFKGQDSICTSQCK